jgi:hypothetical protein
MKIKKKPKSFHILGYILELIINIWQIWAIFSIENPLYRSKFGEISPIKKTLVGAIGLLCARGNEVFS